MKQTVQELLREAANREAVWANRGSKVGASFWGGKVAAYQIILQLMEKNNVT